ncbi:MAG TPA: aldo/keto reductase [Vitreimonas sp.]|uniref:aldo/keto reductase n=1 Tax=Vitreimonas sp. TaxID=3069702 RepID=UPI002D6F773F|nr:aldo/keto reductase [Vitreimonas sp.]HYD89607.1 aldo/keto reductase [Vitreimonas sp.]
MRYRKLGRTGLAVSEICLGTMTFGGDGFWKVIGALEQEESTKLVRTAFDQGVTFIDTADVYSNGLSEQVLGRAIRDLPRDELVIATKVFGRMGAYSPEQTPEFQRRYANTNLWGLSRKHVFDAIDASLTRLGLDYVDLYQVHAFDNVTPLEETLEALDEVVKSGRARYIGLCNFAAWQIAKALGVSERNGLARFESLQMYYSIAGRDLEREVAPLAKDQQLAILPWSPLAGGFLSGKFTRNSTGEGRRASFDFPPVDKDKAYDIIDVMKEMGDARGVSVAQIALAWLLHQKHVTSVIIGAKTEAQLNDNLAATAVELSSDDLKRLDEVSKLKPEYPGWMLERQGGERASGLS